MPEVGTFAVSFETLQFPSVSNETAYWSQKRPSLTLKAKSTPALPNTALAASQIKGRERYNGFVEALGRRLARGRKLADEVS